MEKAKVLTDVNFYSSKLSSKIEVNETPVKFVI